MGEHALSKTAEGPGQSRRAVDTGEAVPEQRPAAAPLESSPAAIESEFCRVIDRLPCLFFELAPDGTIFNVNRATATLTGYAPEELRGEDWWALFCPREISRRAAQLAEELRSGDVADTELRIVSRRGALLLLHLTTANEYDSEGNLRRIVGLAVDMTGRHRAEEALRIGKYTLERRIEERTRELAQAREEAEKRAEEAEAGRKALKATEQERERLLTEIRRQAAELDAIITSLPDPLVIFDRQGQVTRFNPAAATAYQLCQDDVARRLIREKLDIYHIDGRPLSAGEFPSVRALNGETDIDDHFLLRGEAGRESVISATASPLKMDGSIQGVVAIWRDITDRVQLLREVQHRAAELDATINSIADAVVIYGMCGEVLRTNAAADRFFGFAAETGRHEPGGGCRMHGADGNPVADEDLPITRAMRGETVGGRIMAIHRDGAPHLWVSASAAPIRTVDGKQTGAVLTVTDITPLHEVQAAKDLHLHTISHDLRTPLTVIQGHAQLLLEALAGAGLNGLEISVGAIVQSADKIQMMIEDLVEAARLEGGQLVLERRPVDLSEFLPAVLQHSGVALGVERIANELPPGLPPVLADPDRLERILLNLLTNALRYSPPRSKVRLRAREEGEEVVFSVADKGQGIAAEDLPHIFQRFYRPGGKRRSDSVGLGLYITRMLVEAHGGSITVESDLGKGSTFTVRLPKTGDA